MSMILNDVYLFCSGVIWPPDNADPDLKVTDRPIVFTCVIPNNGRDLLHKHKSLLECYPNRTVLFWVNKITAVTDMLQQRAAFNEEQLQYWERTGINCYGNMEPISIEAD